MSDQDAIIDLDSAKARQMVADWIKGLRGPHRVSIRKIRAARSLSQNAYLWGVVYPAVKAGLEDAWGESMTVEDVHLWLKSKLLFRAVVNRKTGKSMGRLIGSTAVLDTAQFGEYLDRVIRFAGEQLGIEIPAPLVQDAITDAPSATQPRQPAAAQDAPEATEGAPAASTDSQPPPASSIFGEDLVSGVGESMTPDEQALVELAGARKRKR